MLGTASPWVGLSTAPRFDDFVLSTLRSMFPHLVAAFIAACVSVILPFSMFATPGLVSVLLQLFSSSLASLSLSVRLCGTSYLLAGGCAYRSLCMSLPASW
ncbi:hypothetical protein F2Q69_00052065 [Brassica cretica]|uniref:Uncharacterized protein n=1 Tax=Brassica cretica TaxID=69181 RepID=A0A8S9N1J2_BRACR|nr:hypothetical protein F2Q69_00052065 [Brassica cretica]